MFRSKANTATELLGSMGGVHVALIHTDSPYISC